MTTLEEMDDSLIQQLQESFYDAVRKNDLEKVDFLLRDARLNVNLPNSKQIFPIYFAVMNGSEDMVKVLLNNNANINARSFCAGECSFESPIETAARMQDDNLVQLLLNSNCDLDSGNGGNMSWQTPSMSPLQWAAKHGSRHTAELLLAHGADINAVGPFQQNALFYATLADKTDMIKWLIDRGAKACSNGDGRSPLHIAALGGNLTAVQYLLNLNNQLSHEDIFKFTPFSLACLRGHLNIVKYMIMNKESADLDLDDGISKASERGYLDIIEFLISKGANVNASNGIGESPLSIAAKGQVKTVALLLSSGAVIEAHDRRGYTPLQKALMREATVEIATLLIQHGANLHSQAKGVDSPLRLCIGYSNPVVLKAMFDAGLDLTKEAWFQPKKIVREKLCELDYKRSIRYHRQTEQHKQMWNWISSRSKRPATLLEASRVSIRRAIYKANGGRSIMPAVYILPMPKCLQSYISMEDILIS